jgi:hypothetical protein
MAKSSIEIINLLRKTAKAIESSPDYQWGHMGACNCGHLAQQITKLNKAEIHQRAMQSHGDWTEQLNDYCPTSGLPLDDIIGEMLAFGFDADQLKHLERLSDPRVLKRLPNNERNLIYNNREHVAIYLSNWAEYLQDYIIDEVSLRDLDHVSIA